MYIKIYNLQNNYKVRRSIPQKSLNQSSSNLNNSFIYDLCAMQYNYIMWQNTQGQSTFLFKQPQQQSTSHNQQQNIKTHEAGYHNYLITMQDTAQNIPPPHHHIHTQPIQVQTNLVKVQPTQQSSLVNLEYSSVEFILRSSQTSDRSALDTTKTHKDQGQDIENKSSIKFELEDQSQEIEMSPQSSLRKLYKNMNHGITGKVQMSQTQQRRIQVDITLAQSKFQEQSDEDEQQQPQMQKNYKILQSNNLYDLVTFPILKGKMVKCLVKITNNKFLSLEKIIDLYLFYEKKHILRARKKKYRFSTYFEVIGKDKNVVEELAQVKSNFTRTQYKLIEFKKNIDFSQRCSQKSEHSLQSPFSSQIIRVTPVFTQQQQIIEKEDCYLAYQPNFLGLTQQKLILIKSKKNIKKSDRFSHLKNCYQNCEEGRFQKFTTRLAQKRIDGKLTLDFKQRNIEDSSKNMIIQDQFGQAGLMFARIKEDLYILNVMHPFNILQAFFLALCNLDKKIFSK